MRPVTLSMSGFRHYQAPQTVTFSDGCTAIIGSNGAGKSSILQAIEVALFGPEGRSLVPYVTWGHDRMTVELEFEHGTGVQPDWYRVRRSSQRGKHLLDLERLEGDQVDALFDVPGPVPVLVEWESLTRETVAETQALLERLLGFSRSTLRASSLLMQGDAASWVERDPKSRKQVLADVLGLDTYGRLLTETRGRRRAVDTDLSEKRGRLAVLQEHAAPLAQLRQRALDLQADTTSTGIELSEATATLERLGATLEQAEQRDRDRRDLDQQVVTLEARAVALRRVDLEATVAQEKADTIRQDITRLERLDAERATLISRVDELAEAERARAEALAMRATHERDADRICAERDRLGRRIDELTGLRDARVLRAESMKEHEEPCDRCGQTLHDEARDRAVASLMAEAKALNDEVLELSAARGGTLYRDEMLARQLAMIEIPDEPEGLAELRSRLAELERVPADLAAARARLEALDITIAAAGGPQHRHARDEAEAALTDARERLASIEPPVGLDDTRREHDATLARTAALTSERDLLRAKTAETGALLELAETAAGQAATIAGEVALLDRLATDLSELERAYGPNGIPMLILESVAVPAIEEHANTILGRLALDYRVEIRTQTEKADGGLRDALDVIVTTGQGEAAFEQLSGSEKTRVAVALRVALARLLAARRGADCRMLALDEPEGLDATVRPLLVDVLRDLEASRVFDQVLLVSHESDLRDAFDQTIEVERADGGWSRVAGRPVAEVAA